MPNCITPNCQKRQRARGLCESCYRSHLRAIERGETTWRKLIRKGLATIGRISAATAARGGKKK